jgi:hypothetical protein
MVFSIGTTSDGNLPSSRFRVFQQNRPTPAIRAERPSCPDVGVTSGQAPRVAAPQRFSFHRRNRVARVELPTRFFGQAGKPGKRSLVAVHPPGSARNPDARTASPKPRPGPRRAVAIAIADPHPDRTARSGSRLSFPFARLNLQLCHSTPPSRCFSAELQTQRVSH